MFEFLVFENQDLYALYKSATLSRLFELCKQYVTPGNVVVELGDAWVSVTDRSGCDKPMMIVAVGVLSDEDRVQLKTNFDLPNK